MTFRRALSFCLAALAFMAPLSVAGANAGLAAISAVLLCMLARGGDRAAALAALRASARSPVFIALAAYAAWALISSAAGLNPAASLRVFPKDLHKLWAFLAIGAALAAAESVPFAAPMAAGLGLHAGLGVFQAAAAWARGAQNIRAHGFIHPVSYSEIMGLGLIGAAAWAARPPKAGAESRRAAAALLVLLAAALVASQTRAVLAALAAAYAACCVLEPRWRRHALASVLIVGGIIAFWEVMPTGGRNIRNLFSHDGTTSSHRSRFVLWDVAARVARDRPLTGVGPGRYRDAFPLYHPERLDGEESWGNAHNLYLHQLAERGTIGLLFLLAVIAALVRGAWTAEGRRDALSLWSIAATAAFLVMNLTEVAWQTEQVATLFLFIWLLGAGPRAAREIL